MPFPAILIWGAAAVGTAIVGKKIYDSVSDSGSSSSSTTSDEKEVRDNYKKEKKEQNRLYIKAQCESLKKKICSTYKVDYLPSTDAFQIKTNSPLNMEKELSAQIIELKNLIKKLENI